MKSSFAEPYTTILLDNKIIQSILYLLSNTYCLDLKAICIKFINALLNDKLNVKNEDVVLLNEIVHESK